MWYSLTLANCILSITSCKIKVKMQSKTDKLFQIQTIKGENYDEKHWIIKTWKKIDNKWIPAKETKAKFEGLGSFGLSVKDNEPQITNRFAVACLEGNC
uniref:MAM domain-containing protein n=1 Tax=Wuchereria bancrofti TaxID=6293 RepID=A0AAF5PJL2_WUCBA